MVEIRAQHKISYKSNAHKQTVCDHFEKFRMNMSLPKSIWYALTTNTLSRHTKNRISAMVNTSPSSHFIKLEEDLNIGTFLRMEKQRWRWSKSFLIRSSPSRGYGAHQTNSNSKWTYNSSPLKFCSKINLFSFGNMLNIWFHIKNRNFFLGNCDYTRTNCCYLNIYTFAVEARDYFWITIR